MNYLSLFSGIGAPEKALQNLGINYNLVSYCEIDKFASKSYAAIHNVDESKNLGDITKVDTSKLPADIDLLTYGFPCQDISASGKLKGFYNKENGELTRSGLFFEALRIIEDLKPKYVIAENVKNLTSKRFKEEFATVLNSLEEAGYNNYWKILDAQDFGIPQHRERVFIVSIRKDIDKSYTYPYGSELNKTIENYLENNVGDEYYLSETQLRYILDCDNVAFKSGRNINNRVVNPKIAKTISCRGAKDQRCDITNFVIENLKEEITCKQFKALAYDEQNKKFRIDGTVGTLQTDGSSPKHNNRVVELENGIKIRKLTPRECFRLQGFDDADFDKVESIQSNAQLYKQAGNSICVPVIQAILKELLN